jgi:hypothetical protein
MEAPPVGFSDLYILDTQPEEKTIGMKREGKVEMSGKERKG